VTQEPPTGHDIHTAIRARSFSNLLPWLVLGLLVIASTVMRARDLNHPGIRDLDEAYHAVVARNLQLDPLRPTLIATPYLDYDFRNWQGNHIWLHKPPVALWQMALSMAVFGDANWAMRLPSLLLAGGSILLTFLIGRQTCSSLAGLFAATFIAFSPGITLLVHGRVFSDHVDIAMLFYSLLAVLLLIRAAHSCKPVDAALVGIVQGVAWMTKSYPALFVTLVAVVLMLACKYARHALPENRLTFSPRQLIFLIIATLVTVGPWVAWCMVHFPREFLYEQGHVFQHLYTDIEQFAAPWDRLLADYLLRGLLEWYPLAMVAVAVMLWDGRRDARRLMVGAWAIIVLLPHLLATSKTPTATLIGWPAAWIAIGILIADAWRGRWLAIGSVVTSSVLIWVWPQRPRASIMGFGDAYWFGKIAFEHWPLFVSAAVIALAGVVTSSLFARRTLASTSPRWIVTALALMALFPYVHVGVRTASVPTRDVVAFKALGERVRKQAPRNAVFLVDMQSRGEWIIAMWWLDRTCYPLNPSTFDTDVRQIAERGGLPMVLSRRDRPAPVVLSVPGEATIYAVR
jgi:4-amino-4-deoxy-L-arabinose transferase-like glycosyltransferase